MRVKILSLILSMMLTGCATSPSINILGAFFPAWLICIVCAIIITALIHMAILKQKRKKNWSAESWSPLNFTILTMIIALIGWIVFFKN